MFFVSVFIEFPSNSKSEAPFHRIVHEYSRTDWNGLHDNLRDVLWEDIFKLGASSVACGFCDQVQVGIDVYIPHRKYKVYISRISMVFSFSSWFSWFLHLHQQNKSPESKVKFRQASNYRRRVLEAAKLAYDNKQMSLSHPRNFALVAFGEMLTVFSRKVTTA